MLTQDKIINTLEKEMPYLRETYHVQRIGLFGSYAKGNYTENSDIDLVVEFNHRIGLEFVSLCEYFEKILGKKVDVLTPTGNSKYSC